MRFGHFFFSIINLLVAVLLIVLGIFIFMIPRAVHFQQLVMNLLTEKSYLFTILGISVGVVGILLLIAFYMMNRRHSYYLAMGNHFLTIDESIIQKYLTEYWKELFPGTDLHQEVALKNNLIHLTVDLPYIAFDEQRKILERIELDLQKLFSRIFDYRKEFYITVSFQEKP
jgi:hypothetical protein